MLDWEEILLAPMRLTAIDLSDIRDMYPFKPVLQRYVKYIEHHGCTDILIYFQT
jgi:hypothetical protein